MKSFILFVFIISLGHSFAQDCIPFSKAEWLKASSIEVIAGDKFPENHVVIGVANYLRSTGMISLEKLTPKMVKSMQKLAVAHHCTKVFVDFDDVVGNFKDVEGRSLHETHIHYYTIRPLLYICKSPKSETNE